MTFILGFWPEVPQNGPNELERKYMPEKAAMMDEAIRKAEKELGQALADARDPSWQEEHPDEYQRVLDYLSKPDTVKTYRGSSYCRICHASNGSQTWTKGPLQYPSGYLHYLTDHYFKPPQDVLDLILSM